MRLIFLFQPQASRIPARFGIVRGKARIEVQASAPDANTMPQALTP